MRVMAVAMVLALMGCEPRHDPMTPSQIEAMKKCPTGWSVKWDLYNASDQLMHITCEAYGVK